MTSPRLRSPARHAPLMAVLALAACGGGGGGTTSPAVTVSTAGGSVTPTPTPTPTASPTPTPTPTATTSGGMTMPTPSGTSVLSPSLSGVAAIASGVDVASHLVKSWTTGAIPELEAGGVEGAFRFLCAPSHNAYDDPIVYPGQPGKSHLHTFFGNTKADGNSTYASLRTTGESTCNNLLNRSAYWIPARMNGRGKVVMPDYVSIYYKRPKSSDPVCTASGGTCLPLPRGLRYVFGYNMSNPAKSSPAGSYYWNCDGAGGTPGHFPNIAQAAKGCPAGARLGAVLSAPNCWNGTELDSADHWSHMAYMQQDSNGHTKCPTTHPYLLPQFTLGAWYTTDSTLDRSGDESATANTWFLASDRMQGMANTVPGTTIHGDWWGAWEDSILSIWTANCIEKQLSCSGGDLGQGQQLDTNAGYHFGSTTQLVNPPAN